MYTVLTERLSAPVLTTFIREPLTWYYYDIVVRESRRYHRFSRTRSTACYKALGNKKEYAEAYSKPRVTAVADTPYCVEPSAAALHL